MTSNLDSYRKDLADLSALGDRMLTDLHLRSFKEDGKLDKTTETLHEEVKGTFEEQYQNWYSEAAALVRQLLPDRLDEFEELYRGGMPRKGLDATNYSIQDWLNGVRSGTSDFTGEKHFNDLAAATMRFSTQLQIVKATSRRFDSRLFEIRQLVQADLFDSELAAGRELAKQRFLRAAGSVGGVVLEKHLLQVAANHSVPIREKHPTIGDLNDALKNASVLDVPGWRQIQRLADLRNICSHNRQREPTGEEVEELLAGVEKTTKTIF